MYKKFICRLLTIFLFVFISVTFLVPSDLVAETRKFWVSDGHYEDQNFWVTSGYLQDTQEKRWVDTSYTVSQGYWDTKVEWIDTSHMLYQGYWKDLTHSVWIDTSQWVSSGYWGEDLTESVWVDTSHNEWVEEGHWESEWVDTSHNVWVEDGHWVWVSSGYTANRWVVTSHWVWVSSGYTANRWVDTSHWAYVGSKLTWVSSGYWQSYWVDTSHNVWVESGYWQSYWVDTSHNVWVEEGHWESYWVDTSHNVWVEEGHWESYWVDTSQYVWVDTSHNAWVSSGYSQNTWVVTSHWVWVTSGYYEDQKVWVEGHYETRYREVEDWQPCNEEFVIDTGFYHWWRPVFIWHSVELYVGYFKGIIDGTLYKYDKYYTLYGSTSEKNYSELIESYTYVDEWGNTAVYTSSPGTTINPYDAEHPIKIRYKCYEFLNGFKKEAYSVWVPPDYNKEWVDTSHWEESGYWQDDTYTSWVDTSYWKSEGHWETKKEWVDTSYMVESGYWEYYTEKIWVDTSHSETRDVWVDTSHWVEAELDPKGKVLHTDQWDLNRIDYNLSETGDPEKPRGYEIFFNGERFVLEADTPGDFQPESVHVEFLGTVFETDLTNTEDIKWEGYVWDESFIYFHDRDCVFRFTASYDYNGDQFEVEDDVTVYVVRDYYWELHRGF